MYISKRYQTNFQELISLKCVHANAQTIEQQNSLINRGFDSKFARIVSIIWNHLQHNIITPCSKMITIIILISTALIRIDKLYMHVSKQNFV